MSRSYSCRAARLAAAIGALWLISTPVLSHAQVNLYQITRSLNYTQNSTAVPTTEDSAGWGVDVDLATANAFDSGSIAYTGNYPTHPFVLSVQPTFMGNGVFQPSLAALNSNFAAGNYTLTVHDSTNTNSDGVYTINYTGDAYTNVGAVTPATYTGLQGMDATQPFTLNVVPFVYSPSASTFGGSIFIDIVDASFNSAFVTSLTPSDTSALIPANMLSPGTSYTVFMNYSDGIYDVSNDARAIQSFQSETSVPFSTAAAVPEPASTAMIGLAIVALCAGPVRRRRRRIERATTA